MDVSGLRKGFILDEDEVRSRMQELVSRIRIHCQVDMHGRVHFENKALSGIEKVKLVIAARSLAAELDEGISAEVTIPEISENTGLAENQVRARCTELVKDRFAESPARGRFRAVFAKVELLLDSVGLPKTK